MSNRLTEMDKIFDTIIIGGGSAGCVLANRLSENPDHKVLMIEAGRKDSWWDIFIHMPAALTYPIGSKFYDWQYKSEPEPFLNNRQVYHARGKVLGGSSSINGMIFIRGNPLDYEKGEKIQEWNHGIILIAFRISKSLKTEQLDQTSGVVVLVLCTSRLGLQPTRCL